MMSCLINHWRVNNRGDSPTPPPLRRGGVSTHASRLRDDRRSRRHYDWRYEVIRDRTWCLVRLACLWQVFTRGNDQTKWTILLFEGSIAHALPQKNASDLAGALQISSHQLPSQMRMSQSSIPIALKAVLLLMRKCTKCHQPTPNKRRPD